MKTGFLGCLLSNKQRHKDEEPMMQALLVGASSSCISRRKKCLYKNGHRFDACSLWKVRRAYALLFSLRPNHFKKSVRRKRPAEVISLDFVAAVLAQKRNLLIRFSALRKHFHTKNFCHTNDRSCN